MKETKNKEWNVIGEMPILNVKKPENDITKKSGIYKITNKINGKIKTYKGWKCLNVK
jgi:hypothetical protein